MAERRRFSRVPQKGLTEDERKRLISDYVVEAEAQPAPPHTASAQEPASDQPPVWTDTGAEPDEDLSFDALLEDLSSAPIADLDGPEEPQHVQAPADAPRRDDPAAIDPQMEASPEPVPDATVEAALETEDFHHTLDDAVTVRAPEQTDEALTDEDAPLFAPTSEETASLRLEDPHTPAEQSPAPAAAHIRPTRPTSRQTLRETYDAAALETARPEPADKWNLLDTMPVDVPHLKENLVITAAREEVAHGAFDVLRTRLVQTMLENGWKRVAVTSPTRNCGKTFTSVNLAISLSRYESSRTILLDFDMRNPSVAEVIGDTQPGKMGDFLRGVIPAEKLLIKFDENHLNIGPSLAIGTNDVVEPFAAELAQEPKSRESMELMIEEMSPDIVLLDMPPALAFDDVIAFRAHFDAVLMVVSGGQTKPAELREVIRRLGNDVPLLGIVLNMAEGEDGSDYTYGY